MRNKLAVPIDCDCPICLSQPLMTERQARRHAQASMDALDAELDRELDQARFGALEGQVAHLTNEVERLDQTRRADNIDFVLEVTEVDMRLERLEDR